MYKIHYYTRKKAKSEGTSAIPLVTIYFKPGEGKEHKGMSGAFRFNSASKEQFLKPFKFISPTLLEGDKELNETDKVGFLLSNDVSQKGMDGDDIAWLKIGDGKIYCTNFFREYLNLKRISSISAEDNKYLVQFKNLKNGDPMLVIDYAPTNPVKELTTNPTPVVFKKEGLSEIDLS